MNYRETISNTDPKMSAQPCGCDPGADYVCGFHNIHVPVIGSSYPLRPQGQTQRPIPDFAPNLAAHSSSGGGVGSQGIIYNNPRAVVVQQPAKGAYAPTRDNRATTFPDGAAERKCFPIATGVLDYFPNALAAISEVSWAGNEQHNPGEPLHWAREKSADHDDTCLRHFAQRGMFDTDGKRHTAKAAWRLLALLELEITKNRGMIE
jgi:hypothetical protein